MEVKFNIPDWLKIPLNILLPAIWIFSGMLMLFPDSWLEILYLLEWRNEKGFAIGLTFVVASCLLLVYFLFYLKKLISTIMYKLTYKRKTMRRITNMNDIERAIIFKLYNSMGHTYELDYNQPLTQGLLARNYIYMGGQQQVTLNVFNNCIPARFTLQPFVYQTLDYYRPKLQKHIEKLEKRINKTTNANKKENLKSELLTLRDNYNYMYGGRNEWKN